MLSDPIIMTPVLLSAVLLLRHPHYTAAAHPVKALERNIWPPKSLSYAMQLDLSSTLPTIKLENNIVFIFVSQTKVGKPSGIFTLN
jgi:hypothetical protein